MLCWELGILRSKLKVYSTLLDSIDLLPIERSTMAFAPAFLRPVPPFVPELRFSFGYCRYTGILISCAGMYSS
ncbi:hypothetical protein AX774_g1772 [Zancudomyces culisetae]|uniref:Uncharacterized protein n=1 Tax=Zancudomyces culisetae TaxID=1213189 RepID=A0A1R1PUW9_ZANCU|nr:hypothetical protein AX774_g1772 [Zancudomyces culisetae]|eukprot:OMH84692.1 hypothetical protein AX774_g1772 [Zancudomyces culisetae]